MASPGVNLPDEMVAEVDRIAYERSEPGRSVSRSEIIREAITEYLENEGRELQNDDQADPNPADA